MRYLYKFFKSVKLAITVVLIITVMSILATLIPQGKEISFYYHNYSRFLALLIVSTNFCNFFKSAIFLSLVFIFFINLFVCAVDRLTIRFKRKIKKKLGPDILHIGVLILIIGTVITALGRRENIFYLGEGDTVQLPGKYSIHLKSFKYIKYEDGRPKDWISTIDVEKNQEIIIDSFSIEVNKPLKIGSMKVYQDSYYKKNKLILKDSKGNKYTITPGQGFESEDILLIFVDIEKDEINPYRNRAVFKKLKDNKLISVLYKTVSNKIGDFTIESISSQYFTGLKVVVDPGFIPVIFSLILIAFGITLTFVQKMGRVKK